MWFTNRNPALRQCWHPVAYGDDVDDTPQRVELLGEGWMLARLGGELVALRDECPHRLAPLSAGSCEGDRIRCGYHGWAFDGDGAVVEVPALGERVLPNARIDRPAAIEERYGLIWLALEAPITPLPTIPEFDDPEFTVVPLPALDWSASAGQMADNFLDVAHFPFTHASTFGDPDDRLVMPYGVEREEWTFTVEHRHSTKALSDSHPDDPEHVEFAVHERANRFVFTAPHHVYLRIDYEAEGVVLVIVFFHSPIDATTTRLFCMDLRNDIIDGRTTSDEARDFQLAVAGEDRALLEQMRHKGVPLGPGHESSTRADRITIELRRVLSDLAEATGAELEARPPTTGPWRADPVEISAPETQRSSSRQSAATITVSD